MKIFLVAILFVLASCQVSAQQNARNGHWNSPIGEIRLFVVFADVIDDTCSLDFPQWPTGNIPLDANQIIDDSSDSILVSYLSKFYEEASMGTLHIRGDYYPFLLEFTTSEIEGNGLEQVINRLNRTPGYDIITEHGHNLSYFDNWTYNSTQYSPCLNSPDSKIDMLVIVWRRNSKYRTLRDGGNCDLINESVQIKSLAGVNSYAILYCDDPSKIFRHEFGHALLGGNSYHTGGAGTGAGGHFLSNVGGYSLLSSHNHNLESCNGWDRWWLGWKHPDKIYDISALDTNGNEVNADIAYIKNLQPRDYILRDFIEYGDAVRIKLPYLRKDDSRVRNQYLWIENHQIKEGSLESTNNPPKGIRFNIQVGNDSLTGNLNNSRTNYFIPLSSFGNYDFVYYPDQPQSPNNYKAYAYDSRSNPFEGHHPAMMPAIDYDGDDTIKPKEFIIIKKLFKENRLKVDDWTVYGNAYDAFPIGAKIGLSSNPPTTPLMTFRTASRTNGRLFSPLPETDDNRTIWLNGLSVKIVGKDSNGDIRIRVCFDDYQVDSNVRWCGTIMLTENVVLSQAKTIDIDYGYTPIRPVNPSIINDEKIFSSPTVFTCRDSSCFKQESFSTVNVKNMSTLVLESGSLYEIEDNAVLNIQSTGTLLVKTGATLRIKGTGHVEVKGGAHICIEDGANIELVDELSALNLRHGYQLGLNPSATPLQSNCTSSPLTNFALGAGSLGQINEWSSANRYIQDTTYYGNAYEFGNSIQAGYDVTIQKPNGNVILESGSHVIIDAEYEVKLEPGVVVELGAELEVRK